MEDIDQSRFALLTALSEAHKARPSDYPSPGTLITMSDEGLRSHAAGLLRSLEAGSASDSVAAELREELRSILDQTP
jgi:hypothetical protein